MGTAALGSISWIKNTCAIGHPKWFTRFCDLAGGLGSWGLGGGCNVVDRDGAF